MTDLVAVTVLEAAEQLFEEVQSLVQRQTALLEQVVEQLAALDVLEDQEPAITKLGNVAGAVKCATHKYCFVSYTSYRRSTCG